MKTYIEKVLRDLGDCNEDHISAYDVMKAQEELKYIYSVIKQVKSWVQDIDYVDNVNPLGLGDIENLLDDVFNF